MNKATLRWLGTALGAIVLICSAATARAQNDPQEIRVERHAAMSDAAHRLDTLINEDRPKGLTPEDAKLWDQQTAWLTQVRTACVGYDDTLAKNLKAPPGENLEDLDHQLQGIQSSARSGGKPFENAANPSVSKRFETAMGIIDNIR